MTRTEEQERARQQLIDAVKEWRGAICMKPAPKGSSWHPDGDYCVGDNHLEECPVERARQDIIAAHNKVEQLHAG